MNIALLFNADHKTLGSFYGDAVMKRIFKTGVLQIENRQMRVLVGDITTFSAVGRSKTPTLEHLMDLCQAVYRPTYLDCLSYEKLEKTHGTATVYCWVFQNMPIAIAERIHSKLSNDPAYLGAMDVVFSDPLHLQFFRNSLIEKYRFHGKNCSVFYSMGVNEDPDISVKEAIEDAGFVANYEDVGARRTIFDDFDSLEHFKRVEDFVHIFAELDGLGSDRASDITLSLEEVHPKFFDAFASAARTLARAETEEDYAQTALSGRRLLEKTANYLFPAREETWNGKKVGKAEYRNRLWAYIEQTITESGKPQALLKSLGKEADRLSELFNAGLHASPTKIQIEAAFVSLVIWLSEVIELSPAAARRPYLAYTKQLKEFVKDALKNR